MTSPEALVLAGPVALVAGRRRWLGIALVVGAGLVALRARAPRAA